jgi:hypothetical protein
MFEKRAMGVRILKIDSYFPFYCPISKHCLPLQVPSSPSFGKIKALGNGLVIAL